MHKLWPLTMIVCYGLIDALSTFVVYVHLGTFRYERGFLPTLFFAAGGIPAFVAGKLALTVISAALLYYLAKYMEKFDTMCTLMCIGASIVGVLSGISNLHGALALSTQYILGISADKVGYLLFILFFAAGLVSVAVNYSGIRARS